MSQPSKRKVNSRFRIKGFNHPAVKVLIILNIVLWTVGLYMYIKRDNNQYYEHAIQQHPDSIRNTTTIVMASPTIPEKTISTEIPEEKIITTTPDSTSLPSPAVDSPVMTKKDRNLRKITVHKASDSPGIASHTYTVATGIAHFHNAPDEHTRRNAFINHWNKAILHPLEEKNGFIYILYKNDEGQVSKGWLDKKDLKQLN